MLFLWQSSQLHWVECLYGRFPHGMQLIQALLIHTIHNKRLGWNVHHVVRAFIDSSKTQPRYTHQQKRLVHDAVVIYHVRALHTVCEPLFHAHAVEVVAAWQITQPVLVGVLIETNRTPASEREMRRNAGHYPIHTSTQTYHLASSGAIEPTTNARGAGALSRASTHLNSR